MNQTLWSEGMVGDPVQVEPRKECPYCIIITSCKRVSTPLLWIYVATIDCREANVIFNLPAV